MKARNLSGRDVIRILKEDGWIEVGVRGSHHYFKHPVKLGKISVPVHAGKPLKMKGLQYSVVLLPDHEAGGFTVEVPDLPGCVTEGDTFEEARQMAEEAIEGFIEVMREDGDPIPKPTKLEAVVKRTTRSRAKESPIFTTVRVAA